MPLNTKRKLLMTALIEKYGDGSVITHDQLLQMKHTDIDKYSSIAFINQGNTYRVSRARYILTLEDDVQAVKDKYEKNKIPSETKKSVKKLAKLLLPVDTIPSKEKVKTYITDSTAADVASNNVISFEEYNEDYVSCTDMDDMLGGNNINDILQMLN